MTRLASLVLLCVVYFAHWIEVGGAFKFALLMAVPYALLAVVANVGLHFGAFARSRWSRAFVSVLVPNGFMRSGSVRRAWVYIVLNFALNLAIHLVLWLNMTFYCWECTKILDAGFTKFRVWFPLSMGLWLLNLLMTVWAWRGSVRPNLVGATSASPPPVPLPVNGHSNHNHNHNHVAPADKEAVAAASAWSEKEDSVTTKF